MKKKFLKAALSLILCMCLTSGTVFGAFAADFNVAEIIGALTGTTNSGDSINLSQAFAEYLQSVTQEEEDSVIDKFVQDIKNKLNGTDTDTDTDTDTEDESVTIDMGAATNIADLLNLTVNELKKGTPGFTEIKTVSITEEMSAEMAMFSGVLTGLVESLIGTQDIFAGVIGGIEKESTVRTRYDAGNDVINNLPVSGKDYVACLTAEDIKDYTITIYRSGAYKMHIDLVDVEGSAAQSGLSHVFNTTDKAFTTIELGSASININVKFKYTNNYVEVQVDKNGDIVGYIMNMGITFLFQQEDGTYAPEMPYFGVNFEEEGFVYNVNTEYTNINFGTRLMGDADNDGKVNSTDARLVLRDSSALEELDETSEAYCDVTQDKKITAADAREILRYSAKLTELPTTEQALGIKEYTKDEAVQRQIDDLLVLMLAYQAAADAEEQKALQDSYNQKYDTDQTQETTTGELNTDNKVDEVFDFIGSLVGGI